MRGAFTGADSSSPFLFASAPVNAPRMWPNSSDSSSVSGSAPQLSATNGRSRRSEWKWIACATRPLPVPDSPVSRIVLLVRETVSIILNTASIGSLRPMMFENWCETQRPLQQHVLLPQLPVLDLFAHLHLQQIDVKRLAQVVART